MATPKCCHLDPIPTDLLKQVIDNIIPAITTIVNKSLLSCTFPQSLKSASVVPLLKKKNLDKEDLKNYRPVSNLAYISKLIEKMAVEQLREHMDTNLMHEPCQSAYRKGHGTETALLKITNDILCAMDDDKCTLVVMLDLSAAFDTVSHAVLLKRMKDMYGVKSNALQWLQSYFSGRSQAVKIEDATSVEKPLHTGLPQGSLLGPFAFPSYSAPLFNIARMNEVEMHMYADDTQLYLHFKPHEYDTAIARMQHCLVDIRKWMNSNMLKLNDSKTEFMVIGKKVSLGKLPDEKSIIIGDERIVAADKAKNIGVMLDSNLSMSSQISTVCRDSYLQIYNISKIRTYLDKKSTATLVHAMVTSKLDSNNSLLYGCPDTLLDRLQMVQNNAARLIYRKRHGKGHITPLLVELHWLPIEDRIEYKICLIVHKCLNHQSAPLYLQSLVTPYQPRRPLRSAESHRLDPPTVKQKRAGERSFLFAAAKSWNQLPLELKTCAKTDCFKSSLKTYLFKDRYKRYT